ncbi:MAG: hypothetical protein KAT43_02805 [Nanoarchaeota archaeon]|nr:hypothetical protein [Nanoarchaeota archaeon]
MAYMKQNVNFVLLFFIILASVTILGSTVYYQLTLKDLSGKYNDALVEMDTINKSLGSKLRRLADVRSELELKSERETELSGQFTEIKSTKEELEKDKSYLQGELNSAKLTISTTKTELANAQQDIAALQTDLANARKTLLKLDDDLEECEDDLHDCQEQLD